MNNILCSIEIVDLLESNGLRRGVEKGAQLCVEIIRKKGVVVDFIELCKSVVKSIYNEVEKGTGIILKFLT